VRSFFEPRLGCDLRAVRVHTDLLAGRSAGHVGALAYTVGDDIAFGAGRFDPGSRDGMHLLAHELAHVKQQRAGGPRLARQPQPRPSPTSRFAYYDRSEFGGRFDAQVDAGTHTVTIVIAVDFALAFDPTSQLVQQIPKFKADLKRVVEGAWSNQFGLSSGCIGEIWHAKFRVDYGSRSPHTTIYVHPDTPGGRSNAPGEVTNLQISDTDYKEHRRPFQRDKRKPPEDMTFDQIPAVHEFGHLMGLSHPTCPGDEDRCYGVTPETASDIMGMGSNISRRDYQPFIDVATRYGRDALPPDCNTWKLVEAG
jgi:hypothetical protein